MTIDGKRIEPPRYAPRLFLRIPPDLFEAIVEIARAEERPPRVELLRLLREGVEARQARDHR